MRVMASRGVEGSSLPAIQWTELKRELVGIPLSVVGKVQARGSIKDILRRHLPRDLFQTARTQPMVIDRKCYQTFWEVSRLKIEEAQRISTRFFQEFKVGVCDDALVEWVEPVLREMLNEMAVEAGILFKPVNE